MPLKQMGILEEIYDQLKNFRDEKGLTSFSNAIQTLLNFYEKQESEVTTLFNSKMEKFEFKMNEWIEKQLAELEKTTETRIKKVMNEYLEKNKNQFQRG